MVQIWQMEPYPCGDPRLPHHVFPPKMITPDELSRRTGTLYWKLDTLDQVALSKRVKLLKMERNFNKEDIFTLDAETTANFRDKIDELFEESNHPEDQARMIIEGSAYYDVEDKNGDWVRILCEFGDLILIPANTSFRFTTTPQVSREFLFLAIVTLLYLYSEVQLDNDYFLNVLFFQNFVKMRRFYKEGDE
ncbi:unnamed protein product [Angiostrongylus costaricensis]|uniref:ARD n=1 Tax=Angiostrongylus costaricensis TaxID=334426 RepID=A0A0R3PR89_ANGCS|nr:unnamed protein product [Angiostrongylus costaricensis]